MRETRSNPSRHRLVVAAALIAARAAGAAEPPPGVFEATERAFAECVARGSEGEILDGFETEVELNGDGIPDYISDIGRIACDGIPGALCSEEGCARTVWLSGAEGNHRRISLGNVLELERSTDPESGLPVLDATYGAAACGRAELNPGCRRSWSFEEGKTLPPPFAPPSTDLRPRPRPPWETLPRFAARPGWTLREVPNANPIALGIGPEGRFTLAGFCLQDAPFLAMRFRQPPEVEAFDVSFAFSSGDVATTAVYEETAGGAFVIDLTETPLAARLAGSDRSSEVTVGDEDAGQLSLAGSTRSLRSALRGCYDF